MIILTRNDGQSIKIGDDVDITVLSSSSKQVRIGVSAPPTASIIREEIRFRPSAETLTQPALVPDDNLEKH